jgi:hypothetical protein
MAAPDRSKTVAEKVLSRFEEGKPADPTDNMSPEDAKEWREQNEKNKDKFKSANATDFYRDIAQVQRTLTFDLINPLRGMAKEDDVSTSQKEVDALLSAARKVQDLLTNMAHVKMASQDLTPIRVVIRHLLEKTAETAGRKPKDVFERHQLKVLLDTMKAPAAMAGVMGGPGQEEAEEILRDKYQYTDSEIRRLKQARISATKVGA